MILAKVFAIVAALLLVSAVALATLGPADLSLGAGLESVGGWSMAGIEQVVRTNLSNWVWQHPVKACLGRPLWLVPAALGLLMAGVATTLAGNRNVLNSRRRRS